MYMVELRPYFTIARRTRKLLYLSFYSTDFNNFFQLLLRAFPPYRESIKFSNPTDYGFLRQEKSKIITLLSIF